MRTPRTVLHGCASEWGWELGPRLGVQPSGQLTHQPWTGWPPRCPASGPQVCLAPHVALPSRPSRGPQSSPAPRGRGLGTGPGCPHSRGPRLNPDTTPRGCWPCPLPLPLASWPLSSAPGLVPPVLCPCPPREGPQVWAEPPAGRVHAMLLMATRGQQSPARSGASCPEERGCLGRRGQERPEGTPAWSQLQARPSPALGPSTPAPDSPDRASALAVGHPRAPGHGGCVGCTCGECPPRGQRLEASGEAGPWTVRLVLGDRTRGPDSWSPVLPPPGRGPSGAGGGARVPPGEEAWLPGGSCGAGLGGALVP